MNKCCGTCKWWDKVVGLSIEEGSCDRIRDVPSVKTTKLTYPSDGQDCPLYEQKDGEKE